MTGEDIGNMAYMPAWPLRILLRVDFTLIVYNYQMTPLKRHLLPGPNLCFLIHSADLLRTLLPQNFPLDLLERQTT